MVSTPRPPETPLEQIDDLNFLLPSDAEIEAYINTVAHQSAEREAGIAFQDPIMYSPLPSSELQNEKENACAENLPMDVLLKLRNEANSRRNFAFKQSERVFTYDERLSSNCQGKRGKKALDAKRLSLIKMNTLKLWPLENKKDETSAWRECRKVIDEGGRQLNHRVRLRPNSPI